MMMKKLVEMNKTFWHRIMTDPSFCYKVVIFSNIINTITGIMKLRKASNSK